MGDKSQKSETNIHPALQGSGIASLGLADDWFTDAGPMPSQYVGIDPLRRQGMEQSAQMAQQGTAVPGAGLGNWLATQQGQFLSPDSNPWLRQNVQGAVQAGMPGITGGFAKAGRFGGGAMANAYQDMAQSTAAQLYGQNYQRERQNMMSSLGMMPQMYEAQFADQAKMMQMGQMYEQDQAQQQQEAMRQWAAPMTRVGMYNQAMQSNPLSAYRKTESWQPFDWAGAGMSAVSGMMSPQIPGMGGKG
jgi:hypothetical protein